MYYVDNAQTQESLLIQLKVQLKFEFYFHI